MNVPTNKSLSEKINQNLERRQENPHNDPRFIDTLKFIEARAKEVHYFQEFTRKKHIGRKLAAQTLPKHMRRRSMSHNRKRIPSRIRKIAKDGFTKSIDRKRKFNLRKTARKRFFRSRTNLLELFAFNLTRKTEEKLLETHQFQAKRMKMATYQGFRVAKRGFAKQFKTAYKFSMNNCLVLDKSFFSIRRLVFESKENLENAVQFLSKFANYYSLVEISDSEIICVIEPGLSEDLDLFLGAEGIKLSSEANLSGYFNVFELIGPNSLKTLARFFRLYLPREDFLRDKIREFEEIFSEGGEPCQLPGNYEEKFELGYKDRIILSEPFTAKEALSSQQFVDFKQRFYQFLIEYKSENQGAEFFASNFYFVEKLTAEYEKIRECIKISSEEKNDSPGIYQRNFIKQDKQISISELFEEKNVPLLIKNDSRTATKDTRQLSKILVLSPASTGNFVLKNLCKNGAKLIGTKEHDFFLRNHGFRIFPCDFIETKSSKQFHQTLLKKQQEKFLKYPDNKKFDFFANNFPLPFGADPGFFLKEKAEEFGLYRFALLGKGSVKPNAMIFECKIEDFSHLTENPNYTGLYSFIMNYKEEDFRCREARHFSNREFDSISDYSDYLAKETAAIRRPIGQITSGGFNYLKMRSAGICFVLADAFENSAKNQSSFFEGKTKSEKLRKISKESRGLVLIRNPKGFEYNLAFLY